MTFDVEPLFRAVRKGDTDVITSDTVKLVNENGDTLLHQAAAKSFLDKVDPALLTPYNMLLSNPATGKTPFSIARDVQQLWALPAATKAGLFPKATKPLRPYQQQTVDAGLDWSKEPINPEDANTREALVCLATGLGKTTVSASLIREMLSTGFTARLASGEKFLWLVHRDELINQAVAEIEALTGEPCEVEKADKRASGLGRVVVASVQSLHKDRLEDLTTRFTPSMIIIDEAHHSAAPSYEAVKNAWENAKILNLTATNFRNDMRGAMNLGRELIYMTFKDGVKAGYLVPPKLLKKLELDLSGVGKRAGDYEVESLSRAMCREDNVRACMTLLEKHLPGQRSLIYAASVGHGNLMGERLAQAGISVGAVFEATPLDERKDLYAKLRRGEIPAIINYNILLEGFDMPELTQIVNMRPTTSDVLSVQMWGRGGRPDPNNPQKVCFFALDTADKKKERRGLHVILPSDEELKKARAHESNPTLTRWELFLNRFKPLSAMVTELKTGAALPEIKTPEDIYRVFKPKFTEPDPILTKLREIWSKADTAKEIKVLLSLLHFTDAAAFTKSMVERGYVFLKNGEVPKDLVGLESLVEDNSDEFANNVSGKSEQVVDPVYKVLGDIENFMMEIADGRVNFQTQVETCVEDVTYPDGTTVRWLEPLKSSGQFQFLSYSAKVQSYSMKSADSQSVNYLAIRDKESGHVALFTTSRAGLREAPSNGFNPATLPSYCKSKEWMLQSPTPKQNELLVGVLSRELGKSRDDVLWFLDPTNPNRMKISRMSASVILASHVFNRRDFAVISKRYDTIKATMQPVTSSGTQPPKPTKPATRPDQIASCIDGGLNPVSLFAEIRTELGSVAAALRLDVGQLNAAVTKELWSLHRNQSLNRENVALALKDPELLISKMLDAQRPEID
jgi:superfamily II DNA or RNA helicase